MALTVEVTEVLGSAGTNRQVSVGHALEVDVVVELHVHCAMTLVANHVGEPFHVVNSAEVVEAVSVGSLIVFNAVENVIVAVHANKV